MKTSSSRSATQQLHQSVEDFLEVQSNHFLTGTPCASCGAGIVQVNATFFLLGGDQAWNIPVPLCPRCDLNDDDSVRRRAKALLTQ